MPVATPENRLKEHLAAFEMCLETPLVPGEFEPWLAAARETLGKVDGLLRLHLGQNHRAQLREIKEEDNEMFARVEGLVKADAATLEKLGWLHEWGVRLADRTAQTEPDEGKLVPEFGEFITQGIDFVIHVRKQELAISTWLGEAFNRERGSGD